MITRLMSAVAAFTLTGLPHPIHAQPYSLDWHTIDGGGGTSTIGQPAAGPVMTGGAFSIQGGFWALPVAVQVTNAPTLLMVAVNPGYARISWEPTHGWIRPAGNLESFERQLDQLNQRHHQSRRCVRQPDRAALSAAPTVMSGRRIVLCPKKA